MFTLILNLVASIGFAILWELLKIWGQKQSSPIESLVSAVCGPDGWVVVVKLFLVALSVFLALFALGASRRYAREVTSLRKSFARVFEHKAFAGDQRIACLDYEPLHGEEAVPIKYLVLEETYSELPERDHAALTTVRAILKTYQITQQIKSAEEELTRQTDMIYEQYLGKLAWPNFARIALPMLGFLGTVIGIMIAMNTLSEDMREELKDDEIRGAITNLIGQIGVAFDTTVIALVLTFFVLARITWAQMRMDQEVRSISQSFDPVFQRLTVPNWSRITERYIEQAFTRAHASELAKKAHM